MKNLTFVFLFLISFTSYSQGNCDNQTELTYHGYEYDVVDIGGECWFSENLNTTKFSNGDDIPGNLSSVPSLPAQCGYNNIDNGPRIEVVRMTKKNQPINHLYLAS